MTKLSTPYIDTELYSRILIKPQQINNDIYINLKNNLKKKVEKKCNKYGFITKIYKILDFSEGEVVPENFDSSVVFNIKFSCRICLPVTDTNIICKIDLLNKSLIKASNGPIVCIIGINYINKDNFSINNKGDIIDNNTNEVIKANDYIVVNIKGTNFFPGDERIVILGGLQSIPSNEKIESYYKENLEIEKIVEDEPSDIDNLSNDNSSEISDVENDNYLNL
tara:strand:- start:934 stop:1602 length:669 start_codon:yes stop_codon:yes gene_type:complete